MSAAAFTLMSNITFGQVLGSFEFHGSDQNDRGGLNTNASESDSLKPTYVAGHCLTLSSITPIDNSYTPHPRSWSTRTYNSDSSASPTSAGGNGLSGDHANCFSGWSSSYDDKHTLSFTMTFANDAVGAMSGVSFDIANYGGKVDPDRFKLLVLRDGVEIFSSDKNRISGKWQNKSFDFTSSVSSDNLSSSAGESTTFTFKLGAYGEDVTSSGMIGLDNIHIYGKHTCVPEPSSAAMLGLAGLAVAFRRRKN